MSGERERLKRWSSSIRRGCTLRLVWKTSKSRGKPHAIMQCAASPKGPRSTRSLASQLTADVEDLAALGSCLLQQMRNEVMGGAPITALARWGIDC